MPENASYLHEFLIDIKTNWCKLDQNEKFLQINYVINWPILMA